MLIRFLRNQFEISHNHHSAVLAMEGLRGFAVFLVFLVHFSSQCQELMPTDSLTALIAYHIHNLGNVGVDLFFVLSGYLIYGMLIKRDNPFWPYLKRRIQRIYPTFMVVFAIYLVLSLVLPAQSKLPGGLLQNSYYLLQNFLLLPGVFPIEPMITVAWSLSYEFFFYLITPLVIAGLRLKGCSRTQRVILLLLIAVAGFIYNGVYEGPIRMLMFISGMLLFELVAAGYKPMRYIGLGSLVGVMILIPIFAWAHVSGWYKYVLLFGVFLLLCWECFCVEGITKRIFCWVPLRWYGNMSYSYYLIHGLTLKFGFVVVARVVPEHLWGDGLYWVLMLPMFVATLLVSSVLFILVERPFSLAARKK